MSPRAPGLDAAGNVLVVVCGWCQAFLHTKPAHGAPGGISHGLCTTCGSAMLAEAAACRPTRPSAPQAAGSTR